MRERLDDLGKSFARHLRAEGLSDRTIAIYGQSVRFFATWLAEQDRKPTLDELSRAAIREWLAHLSDRGLENGTIKTRFRGLYRFCGWLVDEGELVDNPMARLSPPQPAAKPVPVLTDEELTALLKTCAGKDFKARRDAALFRLLLDCGVRVSEVCGLAVDDIDLDQGMAMVRGKGNKVRPIYFGARTARALDRYLRARRNRWAHLDALFLTQRGSLSTDGARERVKVRAAQAGIEDLHPHRFRHTFAHDFLMNGGQERDLKRLAGWSSDVMLERYGASAADARAKAAAKRMKRGDRV